MPAEQRLINPAARTYIWAPQDFSLEQWKRIYINYSRLEDVIDGFMPNSRRADKNRYARSLRSVRSLEYKIRRCACVTDIDNVFMYRYFKVNPEPQRHYKTAVFVSTAVPLILKR